MPAKLTPTGKYFGPPKRGMYYVTFLLALELISS
jgi:hypothetical protein